MIITPKIDPPPPGGKPSKRQTKAEAKRQLAARIEPLPVIGQVAYIDTFAIQNPDPIPRALRDKLDRMNPGKIEYDEGEWQHWTWQGIEFHRLQPSYLRIHQPSPDTVRLISRSLPDHQVCRIDVSLDYLTRSQADANHVHNVLSHILRMPWRRADWTVEDYGNGTYFRWWTEDPTIGRYLLGYADKPSKVTGDPCAHFDLRTFGIQACRSCGVYCAEDLFTFDARAYVAKRMRFSATRWHRAAKLLDEEASKYDWQLRGRRRRPAPGFDAATLRRRILHRIGLELLAERANDDDAELPTWGDFPDHPVQRLLDAAYFLREAVVSLPPETALSVSVNVQNLPNRPLPRRNPCQNVYFILDLGPPETGTVLRLPGCMIRCMLMSTSQIQIRLADPDHLVSPANDPIHQAGLRNASPQQHNVTLSQFHEQAQIRGSA